MVVSLCRRRRRRRSHSRSLSRCRRLDSRLMCYEFLSHNRNRPFLMESILGGNTRVTGSDGDRRDLNRSLPYRRSDICNPH